MTKAELDHGYYVEQKDTPEYKERNSRGTKKWRHALKVEVLTHYGSGTLRCMWPLCLVVDVDMLTLDHVYNDGAEDRRRQSGSQRGPGGQASYRQVKRAGFPTGFQTLCCNHQMKKEIQQRKREHNV